MSQNQITELQKKEREHLLLLLWFYWTGIIIATVGGLGFVALLSDGASGATGELSNTTLLVGFMVTFMWLGVLAIYKTRFGGDGVPTAIFCWMLAKGGAALGMVTFFLDPNWQVSFGILTGFLIIMGLLQPPVFLPEKSQDNG